MWGTVGPRTALSALRTTRATGHTSSYREGDTWQQGGAFVIFPGGRITLEERAGSAEHYVDPAALLAALVR